MMLIESKCRLPIGTHHPDMNGREDGGLNVSYITAGMTPAQWQLNLSMTWLPNSLTESKYPSDLVLHDLQLYNLHISLT